MYFESIGKPIKRKNELIFLIILLFLSTWLIMVYFFLNNVSNDKVISSTVIAERLSKISELSTVKYNYSNVLSIKNSKKFKDFSIPFTEKSFLIKYSGYIKAGVDLKDLEVVVNNRTIIITLKKAKIFDHAINTDDLFLYDEKSSLFNKLSAQDMIDEISNEKSKVEADLLKTDFLEQANTNTKILLQGILLDMGFETITITFR
ncbi:DUF4230 domain-containing protein [Clostridium sp.]|uniref:DUF4230 domain-containing protein n=1 Tax=Clostridium sp. TaxID=1506 RepID=UPI001A615244|nr:DUF4230 domain-containing protein [Clostridium sp.]MBK5235301.1 DUF4230 domain-containing protein [Clostridium sp.]